MRQSSSTAVLINSAENPTAVPTSRICFGFFIISSTFRKLCISRRMMGTSAARASASMVSSSSLFLVSNELINVTILSSTIISCTLRFISNADAQAELRPYTGIYSLFVLFYSSARVQYMALFITVQPAPFVKPHFVLTAASAAVLLMCRRSSHATSRSRPRASTVRPRARRMAELIRPRP